MIATVDIDINAANPGMPLKEFAAFTSSPSHLRLRNVPRRVGLWELTKIYVSVTFPDNATRSVEATHNGALWTATVAGCVASGTVRGGFQVIADGVDESGNAITGYVLGVGDVRILSRDSTVNVDGVTYPLKICEEMPADPKIGYCYTIDGVLSWYDGTEWIPLGGGSGDMSHADFAELSNVPDLEPDDVGFPEICQVVNKVKNLLKPAVALFALALPFLTIAAEVEVNKLSNLKGGSNVVVRVDLNGLVSSNAVRDMICDATNALNVGVTSVNAKTGDVSLSARDIGALGVVERSSFGARLNEITNDVHFNWSNDTGRRYGFINIEDNGENKDLLLYSEGDILTRGANIFLSGWGNLKIEGNEAYPGYAQTLPQYVDSRVGGFVDAQTVTNMTALAPVYSQTPTFSEWTVLRNGVDVTSQVQQPEWVDSPDELRWLVYVLTNEVTDGPYDGDNPLSVSLQWTAFIYPGEESVQYTATRTRTDVIGYTLGDQTNKVLASTNDLVKTQALTNYYTIAETDDAIDALAAYYITMNAEGDAFPDYAALTNTAVYYSGGEPRTPTRNDYAVVLADETHNTNEWRYIYTVSVVGGVTNKQWEAQYPIETNDYDGLSNKPSIGGVSLVGNKSAADLGLLTSNAISATDSTFSNAVLSVGLGIDTNTVAAINALVDSGDELPIGGATTVGGLLLALAAAIAALKKSKADASKCKYEFNTATVTLSTTTDTNDTAAVTGIIDHAKNAATLVSTVTDATITIPARTDGYTGDLFLSLTVEGSAPSITFTDAATSADLDIIFGSAQLADIDTGRNLILFSEVEQNKWKVAVEHEDFPEVTP